MSLAAIAELVDGLELSLDRAEIQAAFAIRDRLDARIAVAVGEFDAAGLYVNDGAVSMNGWLRHHGGRDAHTATKLTTTGRKLRTLPVLREAALDGDVTGGQLDVVLANIPQRHVDRFTAHEAELVPTLARLGVDDTRRVMDAWKNRADALDPGPLPAEHDNEVHLSRTYAGRGELSGSFDGDTTAIIEAALRVGDPKDLDRPLPERRADALAQICQHFLDHQQVRPGGRHRPHVNVTISLDELNEGSGGRYLDTDQPLSPTGLGTLLCDSVLHRVLHSATSGILDYGRSTRTWPVDLYNAIALRDGGCRIGGCDAPASWCDVHHIQPWAYGGETSISNGLMACRRHHHLIHKPGYHVKLLPDGTAELTHPDGRTETSQPRGITQPPLFRRRPGGS